MKDKLYIYWLQISCLSLCQLDKTANLFLTSPTCTPDITIHKSSCNTSQWVHVVYNKEEKCLWNICLYTFYILYIFDVTYHVNRQKQWNNSSEKFCSLCKALTICFGVLKKSIEWCIFYKLIVLLACKPACIYFLQMCAV